MIPGKKGIQLSINFLVTLIIAIVVFGMGIFLANLIFGSGENIASKQFENFDQQVGELSCFAADNVCINVKTATINRGKFKSLGITIKNALPKKQFRIVVQNTRFIDLAGDIHNEGFEKLLLFGMENGRIESLEKGEKKTFGVGVEVPKNLQSGKYTLTIQVSYADPDEDPSTAEWMPYTDRPQKMFIDVP